MDNPFPVKSPKTGSNSPQEVWCPWAPSPHKLPSGAHRGPRVRGISNHFIETSWHRSDKNAKGGNTQHANPAFKNTHMSVPGNSYWCEALVLSNTLTMNLNWTAIHENCQAGGAGEVTKKVRWQLHVFKSMLSVWEEKMPASFCVQTNGISSRKHNLFSYLTHLVHGTLPKILPPPLLQLPENKLKNYN